MGHVKGEIVIEQPVETVFDFVADERNEPLFNPTVVLVEQTTPGPIGEGTKFRVESASGTRTAEMVITVTKYERPRVLTTHTPMATMDFLGTLTFEAVPEGTLMRWRWEIRPHGFYRLLGLLITRAVRGQEQAVWSSVKEYLESEPSD